MSETKTFDLRTVLSVTTGRLLTKTRGPHDNGIGDMYSLLGWMTNDSPFTHQLGRFAEECKKWLYRWFPSLILAEESLGELDELLAADDAETACEKWVESLIVRGLPATLEVRRIPEGEHARKDAICELIDMMEGGK